MIIHSILSLSSLIIQSLIVGSQSQYNHPPIYSFVYIVYPPTHYISLQVIITTHPFIIPFVFSTRGLLYLTLSHYNPPLTCTFLSLHNLTTRYKFRKPNITTLPSNLFSVLSTHLIIIPRFEPLLSFTQLYTSFPL